MLHIYDLTRLCASLFCQLYPYRLFNRALTNLLWCYTFSFRRTLRFEPLHFHPFQTSLSPKATHHTISGNLTLLRRTSISKKNPEENVICPNKNITSHTLTAAAKPRRSRWEVRRRAAPGVDVAAKKASNESTFPNQHGRLRCTNQTAAE